MAFFIYKYFEARKTDDLYTEFWLIGSLVCVYLLIRFFIRPRVYNDASHFYFKRFNKPEIQVPFLNIQIIEKNPIYSKGNVTYRIQFLDENRTKHRILFYTDSYRKMQSPIQLVKEANHFAKII